MPNNTPQLLSEDIWTQIQRYMTTREWAQAAGTCRASWSVKPQKVVVYNDLPWQGYLFVLRRCEMAESLVLGLESSQATSDLMRALRNLSAPIQIKQMKRLSLNFATDFSGGALAALSMACQSAQAVQLLSQDLPYLHPFPNLGRLVLRTGSLSQVFSSLDGFPHLETLAVSIPADADRSVRPHVDLTHLSKLRHLQLSSFVPSVLRVGEACKVHARFHETFNGGVGEAMPWLQGWRDLHTQLTSFTFVSLSHQLTQDSPVKQLIFSLLDACAYLELVNIVVSSFGTGGDPFVVSQEQCCSFAKARNVSFSALECWLRLEDVHWQNLALLAGQLLCLEIADAPKLLQTMTGFSVECRDARGAGLIELTKALCSVGRQLAIMSEGSARAHKYRMLTVTPNTEQERQSFKRTTRCVCQACSACLVLAGMMPRHFSNTMITFV